MINRTQLLKDLQGLLPHVEKDILAYSESNAELKSHLKHEYDEARKAERTAEHIVAWRESQITQAAVAWVLTCVFVRFLEDNQLLVEPVLSGPVTNANGKEALQHAKERMVAYFNENPTHEERHYLLALFDQLEKFPVIAELLDHRHNPLWQIPVSADGAKRLIDFFQKIDPESGEIQHDFTDPEWDTRFLGDLYQDLSESVRKRYALLQTPEFVESFILDYTLEPAIQTFGLKGLRLIDPTCGSGHFLLTTFERVFDQWQKREPGTNARELAQRALDVVHGVDINPYAIAICRFRLLIAAMRAAGSNKIKDAPSFHFNLACGDSLLHGKRFEWQGQGIQQGLLDQSEMKHVYEAEDSEKLNKMLGQQYHVVVGNPPYIVVRDKSLNQLYRDKYPTCHRQYSLGIPFTERFFDLTLCPDGNRSAGFMGMITANSFMKREFGKKLIEDYLPRKDLTHVIDTSGAYIPGHGTPTVILIARNQPSNSKHVLSVLGIRGEPTSPSDPTKGKVWSSIVQFLTKGVGENDYISIASQPREVYERHPWSLAGGGATELKALMETNSPLNLLSKIENPIGRSVRIAEEDVFMFSAARKRATKISEGEFREFLIGEQIRDWSNSPDTWVWYPYFDEVETSCALRLLWQWKTSLANRSTFQGVMADAGLNWFDYMQHTPSAYRTPLSIAFAEIATHNHFRLDRGGKVFKQTAPVIKLPKDAGDEDHLALLGFLNSSSACFWIKQVFHNKGDSTDSHGARVTGDPAFDTYQIAGTGLKKFPIPVDSAGRAAQFAKRLDQLANELTHSNPKVCFNQNNDDVARCIVDIKAEESKIVSSMIALQEELDWYVYALYGLTEQELCFDIGNIDDLPSLNLGERTFEIHLARSIAAKEAQSTWFERHKSKPIVDIPAHWPAYYKRLVEQRLAAIDQNKWIKLVERPEYKRRWSRDSWQVRLKAAAKDWLLDCCEQVAKASILQTCAQLSDALRKDPKVLEVAEIYTGNEMQDLQGLVIELIESDQVPQIATSRLKPDAMMKFRAWQETWDKQRQEDAIDKEFGIDQPLSEADKENADKVAAFNNAKAQADKKKAEVVGDIPVAPQYKQGDFRKASYWPLRGKLDVPKERFFSLPGCEKDGDSTLVIGWAGMNHLQRALAIAAWYLDRKEGEGWEADRLMPMLVAIDELIPWLKQWHNEVDPEYGERMGDYYEGFLLEELRLLDIPRDALLTWEPPATARARRGARRQQA